MHLMSRETADIKLENKKQKFTGEGKGTCNENWAPGAGRMNNGTTLIEHTGQTWNKA